MNVHKKKIVFGPEFHEMKKRLRSGHLHTVCEEARCPNISECFHSGTATFLIMGDVCTRNCGFCAVEHGKPKTPDWAEIDAIVKMAKEAKLHHIVLTSVTRDDLPDGGAQFIADTVTALKKEPGVIVEVLFPDFSGHTDALDILLASYPDVLNHNIEMVKRLYPTIRPHSDYRRSMDILKYLVTKGKMAKTGFMVGLGESFAEIEELLQEIAETGVKLLTIGQYLQPSKTNASVIKYYSDTEFADLEKTASSLGIPHVFASTFVRSSYRAEKMYTKAETPSFHPQR